MEKWTIVEVLRHARHDWMNQLQLIKGNIALNKLDNVNRIMDEMIVEAQQESRLSNLKLPRFAEILLTFNWEPHPFQIEFEILSENGELTVDDYILSNWIQSFFLTLEKLVVPYQDNNLFIALERHQNDTRFEFNFNGTIIESGQELLRNWLADQEKIMKRVNLNEINANNFSFAILI